MQARPSKAEARSTPAERRLMLVELNEFDPEMLRAGAARLGLRNIQRMLALSHAWTTTDDEVEHHGLDPWVQWVGIHSGVPTSVHGIRRLGETHVQRRAQLWNAVAQLGYTWGVWGVMNAPRGDQRGCAFFMPDPWSFDERAFPEPLNDVLEFPRYVSKNYLDLNKRAVFALALRFVRYFVRPENVGIGLRFAADSVRLVARSRAPIDVHTFTTLIDYLSAMVFIRLRKRTEPNLSVIFLNHIAHLQHYYWLRDRAHPQMELGLRVCDAVIGMLLADRRPSEALVVMNAFRQENVSGRGIVYYRQRNPNEALHALGVTGGRVEQCMTHDANVIFHAAAAADRAQAVLTACALGDGRKVFFVERRDPTTLFYQIEVEGRIDDDEPLLTPERRLRFGDIFVQLADERTGAHTKEGDVYADGLALAERFENHEIFRILLTYFEDGSARASGPPSTLERASA
jgi:hypothetical protein